MDNLQTRFSHIKKLILEQEYARFNPPQREAVFNINGPLLILAGAGSGKTTVIVGRIEYMLRYGDSYLSDFIPPGLCEDDISFMCDFHKNRHKNRVTDSAADKISALLAHNRVKPWNILAITFTNKAAGEMKERLEKAVGNAVRDIHAGTFHSICSRILRIDGNLLGYSQKYVIYDREDSLKVIKDSIRELDFNEKLFPPRAVLNEISSAKDKMMDAKAYSQAAGTDIQKCENARIFELYEARLKKSDAMDFDDLILQTVRLFEQFPEVLAKYQDRFKYILVDEYQDTNHTQYKLISLLSRAHSNICVVGDDDQSIYKFRGATIRNILDFENQYKDARVLRLEQNYRSTAIILGAANAVIANNNQRKGKNLWTDKNGGEKIKHIRTRDETEEAEYITAQIQKNAAENGFKYSDNAVLYRMNAQSQNIERSFVRAAIPYRIFGGAKFYSRKEVKDIISYMSVIVNPNDTARFSRIINVPKRGIGPATVQSLFEISQGLGISVLDVIAESASFPALSKKSAVLCKFAGMIKELQGALENTSLPEFFDLLTEKTGYMDYLKKMGEESKPRIENILEIKTVLAKFESENKLGSDHGKTPSLDDYLEEVALYTDVDEYNSGEDCVVLMTIHSVKGLEFPRVFLTGMEEGIFPSIQSSFSLEELEEERRLAYVGITRAKQELHLTAASQRMIFGTTRYCKTSRFVEEIPPDMITLTDMTRTYETPSYSHRISAGRNSFAQPSAVKTETPPPSSRKKAEMLNFSTGDKVEHPVFGTGIIMSASAMANDTMLEINFDKTGIKKIMANFGKLELKN
ncbi:MAG: UvrD-helicase domain-containing protein [Oscillospiraceae bacterium]|nr:UvrD-helicase domain-containing protein [Oscillospiraceae bacterium]